MGARNRVRIGLSYRPARLHRLAESILWNRFLGTLKVLKYRLWSLCLLLRNISCYAYAYVLHVQIVHTYMLYIAYSFVFTNFLTEFVYFRHLLTTYRILVHRRLLTIIY
jgi:hypothetical protein